MTALSIDTARDAAQQMVTANLHGDRTTASEIALAYPDPLILALVLADLAAYVHHRWAKATGIGQAEAWAELMGDIEEWRTNREALS